MEGIGSPISKNEELSKEPLKPFFFTGLSDFLSLFDRRNRFHAQIENHLDTVLYVIFFLNGDNPASSVSSVFSALAVFPDDLSLFSLMVGSDFWEKSVEVV